MIEFKILGRVPTTLMINNEHVVVYEDKWFDCVYNKKTKEANYLRKGGELGASLTLSDVVVAELTK
jgi:hypothetical protein